jgi:anti-sigma B factor antagonist
LQQQIDAKMKHGSRYFIFDLSQLEYICSGGLRVFIKTQKQLKLFDGLLSLVAPTDHVSKVLEIAELNEILHVEKDILSATNEFL